MSKFFTICKLQFTQNTPIFTYQINKRQMLRKGKPYPLLKTHFLSIFYRNVSERKPLGTKGGKLRRNTTKVCFDIKWRYCGKMSNWFLRLLHTAQFN